MHRAAPAQCRPHGVGQARARARAKTEKAEASERPHAPTPRQKHGNTPRNVSYVQRGPKAGRIVLLRRVYQ